MSNDNPLPQDSLKPVIQAFGHKIGVEIPVFNDYCPLSIGDEMQIHVKYNSYFKAIFFIVKFGALPPSYETAVLLYYLLLNGSPDSDGLTFAFEFSNRALFYMRSLPSGVITLANFEFICNQMVERFAIERAHLMAFAENHTPSISSNHLPVPNDISGMLITFREYITSFSRKLNIPNLDVDKENVCWLTFDSDISVKISLVPHKEMICIFARVARLPVLAVGECAKLLACCNIWRETAGANISLDTSDGSIILIHFLEMRFLTFDLFNQAVDRFCSAIQHWRGKILEPTPTLPPLERDIDAKTEHVELLRYMKDLCGFTEGRTINCESNATVTVVDNVALKCYLGGFGAVSEAEIIAKVVHPCVVKLIGVQPPDRIATSWGTSLREIITGSPKDWFNETEKAKVVCGIVLGMRFVHSRGIVHRDLRPETVIIDEDNCPRIGGFWGVDMEPGKSKYTAPELVDGKISPAADVYGFALILYELIVGTSVFPDGLDKKKVWEMSRNGVRPEIPKNMNSTVKNILTKGWAPDPAIRPSFEAIWNDLKDIQLMIIPGMKWENVEKFVEIIEYGND
jgi:hypothetical protein